MKKFLPILALTLLLLSCKAETLRIEQDSYSHFAQSNIGLNIISSHDPTRAALNTGLNFLDSASAEYIDGLLPVASQTDERYQNEMRWVMSGLASIARDTLTEEARLSLQSGNLPDLDRIGDKATDRLMMRAIDTTIEAAKETGLPFLRNVEVQYQVGKNIKPEYSARTIDALYESPDLTHTIFAEIGLSRLSDRTTLNLGTGYRYMTPDERWLYGANLFYDHEWPYDHQRASIGVEATSVAFRLFANRYIPLSDWVNTRPGFQEIGLGGWDAGASGRLPNYREVELTGTAFQWNRFNPEKDSRGLKLDVGYTPIPQITIGMNAVYDSEVDHSLGASIRYNFNAQKIEQEINAQSVKDLRLKTVNRENKIIVQERQNPNLTGQVTETVGANNFIDPNGLNSALTVGQTIPYGSVITVDAGGGSYAELRFGDGGVLRIGTNSTVRIDNGLITLVSGTMQYVSGATNVTINVPGETITLIGTDIDILSDGAVSTVRVRDGQIITAGITGNTGDIIQLNGAPSILVPGTADFNAHGLALFNRLDSIDPTPLTIAKAAPYIYRQVDVSQSPTIVGDVLGFEIFFSKPVAVTGAVTLDFTINGNPRSATFISGNNSTSLIFEYIIQPADAGTNQATIQSLHLNGGTVSGGGGLGTLIFSPEITTDISPTPIVPDGIETTITSAATNPTATSPIPITITFAEAVTGLLVSELTVTNGTASNLNTADNIIWTADITPTIQGTVTITVPANVAQNGAADTNAQSNAFSIVYNTGAPGGYSAAFVSDPINTANVSNAAFDINGAEIGSSFSYTISSDAGGTDVTGSGTIATTNQSVSSLDLNGLNDGTLTLDVILTSPLGSVGPTVSDTVIKDTIAPTITNATAIAGGVYDDL